MVGKGQDVMNVRRLLTLGDAPPGQRDVGEVGVERRGLRAPALLPQREGLREAAHRPQRVVRAVVQLCATNHTAIEREIARDPRRERL